MGAASLQLGTVSSTCAISTGCCSSPPLLLCSCRQSCYLFWGVSRSQLGYEPSLGLRLFAAAGLNASWAFFREKQSNHPLWRWLAWTGYEPPEEAAQLSLLAASDVESREAVCIRRCDVLPALKLPLDVPRAFIWTFDLILPPAAVSCLQQRQRGQLLFG